MSLIEEILVGTKNIFAKAGKNAEKIVGISRLKINASEIKKQISDKLENLGKITYDAKKKDVKVKQEIIENLMTEIDELYKENEIINKKISHVKNKIKCSICKYENDNNAIFCAQCGNNLSKNSNEDLTEKKKHQNENTKV